MTEVDWLACADPLPMLEFLQGKASDRKLRLFAVACCRRIWHLLVDKKSQQAVEIAERFADCQCSREELDMAWRNSWEPQHSASRFIARSAAIAASAASMWYDPDDVYRWLPNGVSIPAEQVERAMRSAEEQTQHAASWNAAQSVVMPAASAAAIRSEKRSQAELIQDVIGNPFRPVVADPSWLTSTVGSLAQQMYESGDFAAMPLLADALKDAGCDKEEVLNHCRGPGQHVRGCWVVDLLLGKA